MVDYWSTRGNLYEKDDGLREVLPEYEYVDDEGLKTYVFTKSLFNNPRYVIPSDDLELFKKFLNGGSRHYPSDGQIPVDKAGSEARSVLEEIEEVSNDESHGFYEDARNALKDGRLSLIRGTVKLYLGDYTSRDWRRKRFTDDIDFWTHETMLLENVLDELEWSKKGSHEWGKRVEWYNPFKEEFESRELLAANDVEQALDFQSGAYLTGSSLKDVFKKKLFFGRGVDLSDVINVAIVNNKVGYGELDEDWVNAWEAFEEAANSRSKLTISSMISLCRYTHGVADYVERVGRAAEEYKHLILNESLYPNGKIVNTCKRSSNWNTLNYTYNQEVEKVRKRIYENIKEQGTKKLFYANNLRNFASKVIELLNSKYEHSGIRFEIEE